jgi:hypothetical protein
MNTDKIKIQNREDEGRKGDKRTTFFRWFFLAFLAVNDFFGFSSR